MNLFSWLARAMGDGENPSASRLVAVPSLLAIYILPLLIWGGLSIYSRSMVEVPGSVTGFVASVSAPLLVFINRQKKLEGQQQ